MNHTGLCPEIHAQKEGACLSPFISGGIGDTLTRKSNEHISKTRKVRKYISINVLETIVVIINFTLYIFAFHVDGIDLACTQCF